MKVGNSLVLVLPKPLCDGFGIEKGSILNVTARDDGIYIPLGEKSDGQKSGVQPAVTYHAKTKQNTDREATTSYALKKHTIAKTAE